MARLNEPSSIPAESVEALKRRFIRQNRELAKNNSNQSIRIRCLESETSRLLAENLALREDIIQLRNELETRPDRLEIGSIKNRLENKIQELSSLVLELGALQRPENGEELEEKTRRSPGERRSWRRQEMLEERERQLPTILENKLYPRRTLDVEDFMQISDPSSESPDLEPPPIAQFQDEDPIMFDPQPALESDASQGDEKESDVLPAALTLNLETRRRRRDSNNKLHAKRVGVFQSPPESTGDDGAEKKTEQAQPIRAGSKRKLSAREDESGQHAVSNISPDNFIFNRKSATVAPRRVVEAEPVPTVETKSESKPNLKPSERVSQSRPSVPDRKALGEKSINTDPVSSPKKPAKGLSLDKSLKVVPQLALKDSARPRARDRKQPLKSISIEPVQHVPVEDLLDTVEPAGVEIPSTLPPKTPAALDLFSPPSTQPSTARLVSKDTPPPSDLKSGTSTTGAEATGRAGRRARAPVNYAEPSLVHKMRRPGKELVDAVGKDGRPVNGSVVVKKDSEGYWQPAARAPSHSVDREDAPSPLGSKTFSAVHSRASEQAEPTRVVTLIDRSASSSALASASLARSRKPAKVMFNTSSDPPATHRSSKTDEQRKAELAIFDFTETSPERPSSRASEDTAKDLLKSRLSRRHSSMSEVRTGPAERERRGTLNAPKPSKSKEPVPAASEEPAGTDALASSVSRASRADARRRSMIL